MQVFLVIDSTAQKDGYETMINNDECYAVGTFGAHFVNVNILFKLKFLFILFILNHFIFIFTLVIAFNSVYVMNEAEF